MLEGKKTYLVAAIAVLSAVSGFLYEGMTLGEAVMLALTGAGFATVRRGMKTGA